MKEYFVTFRSITFAQRGAVLRSAGIPVQLQRTPRGWRKKDAVTACACPLDMGLRPWSS